jgi:ABC-2 type transport system ATP-binding protein
VSRRPKALAAIEVVKQYGDLLALDEVSVSIKSGELVALVGSNGAGKSTFMRLAAGLLEPTSGTVMIEGEPAGSLHARSRLSYIGDQPALYDDLSLDEHIEYVARLHGLPGRPDSADRLLEIFALTARADDLPARFSRGMRQKSALVLGLIRPLSVLVIDEPFIGLDPTGQDALVDVLVGASQDGAAVMIATHQIDFLEHADRCVALRDGEVAYDGPIVLDEIQGFLE